MRNEITIIVTKKIDENKKNPEIKNSTLFEEVTSSTSISDEHSGHASSLLGYITREKMLD
jgi:hypothetical protein